MNYLENYPITGDKPVLLMFGHQPRWHDLQLVWKQTGWNGTIFEINASSHNSLRWCFGMILQLEHFGWRCTWKFTNVILKQIFSIFLKILCFCRLYWLCIEMLIEEVATALRMDEAKLDSIEDPSFHLTSSYKESETFNESESYLFESKSYFWKHASEEWCLYI